jgi:hypothetical protein
VKEGRVDIGAKFRESECYLYCVTYSFVPMQRYSDRRIMGLECVCKAAEMAELGYTGFDELEDSDSERSTFKLLLAVVGLFKLSCKPNSSRVFNLLG